MFEEGVISFPGLALRPVQKTPMVDPVFTMPTRGCVLVLVPSLTGLERAEDPQSSLPISL